MFSTTLPFLEMWGHPTLQTLQHLQQCLQTLFGFLVCLQAVQDRQKHQTSHDKDYHVRT